MVGKKKKMLVPITSGRVFFPNVRIEAGYIQRFLAPKNKLIQFYSIELRNYLSYQCVEKDFVLIKLELYLITGFFFKW